uniref:Uncharacterized protein n=1 Tax=Timema douglasi TaxID=61478 RepID=A0A7R8W0U1_TIMDO|nr:unnamed protein product [Timema douglasi]
MLSSPNMLLFENILKVTVYWRFLSGPSDGVRVLLHSVWRHDQVLQGAVPTCLEPTGGAVLRAASSLRQV